MHMLACAYLVSNIHDRATASGRVGSRSYQPDSPEFQYSPSSSHDDTRNDGCQLILESEISNKTGAPVVQQLVRELGSIKTKVTQLSYRQVKSSPLVNGSKTTTRTESLDFLIATRKNIALDLWKLNHDLGGNPSPKLEIFYDLSGPKTDAKSRVRVLSMTHWHFPN